MSSKPLEAGSVQHESNAVAAMVGDATNHHPPRNDTSRPAVHKPGDCSNTNACTVPLAMNDLYLTLPSLSIEPMTAARLVLRVQDTMVAVMHRYLPCALFFIHSQCRLDSGLQQQHQQSTNDATFFAMHLAPLPTFFKIKNHSSMQKNALDEAFQGLEQLLSQVQLSCSQGSMQMTLDFTGGLREGQPFGLRKWLSDHGQVLALCSNLEGIHQVCVKLLDDASLLDTACHIAEAIRPMARRTLDQLLMSVPKHVRDHLPCFHRLVANLRNMSTFNPSDKTIDDDDIQEVGDFKPPAASYANQEIISVDDDDDDDDEEKVVAAPKEVIYIDDESSDSKEDKNDDFTGLYKAAVQSKRTLVREDAVDHSVQPSWNAVNGALRRYWGLPSKDNNVETSLIESATRVPPTVADASLLDDAANQNKSKAASLNENEEVQLEDKPVTACSENKGFHNAVVHSKNGAQVTVKRSLRLQ
jgi:hypothetical protein